jgi:hypothetical protein
MNPIEAYYEGKCIGCLKTLAKMGLRVVSCKCVRFARCEQPARERERELVVEKEREQAIGP